MIALTGYYDDQMNSYAEAISEQFELINFQTRPSKMSHYTFNFYPAVDTACNALKDLLDLYKWKHATIFYSGETSLDRISCLLRGTSQYFPKLDYVLKFTNPGDDYRIHLNDTVRKKAKNFIIDLPAKETATFLKNCLQLGLINDTYSFIITTFVILLLRLKD